MAIPAGISTALVHLDAPVSFIGEDGRIHATITSSIPLVWAATGTPIGNFIDMIALDPGVPLELNLPHVDQEGFLDGAGNTITGWSYRIEVTYEKDGQNIPFPARDFQILTGQLEVDLALIPSGEAYIPVVAPILPVTSIDGLTGEVTMVELGLDRVDNTNDAEKPISTATQQALDAKATVTALNSHTGNTANPHAVTKAQVGLGSVDNTADSAKPVSTAQATALGLKVAKGELFFNVKDEGALGNNIADDTAAIQAAIDKAGTAGGGIVYVPRGTYKVSTLRMKSFVTLFGYGEKSTLQSIAGTAAILTLDTANVEATRVVDLRISGTRAAGSTTDGHGVYYAHASSGAGGKHIFRNVRILECSGAGLWLTGTLGGGSEVTNVKIYYCNGVGFRWGSHDSVIMGVDVGQSGSTGFRIEGSNNRFIGCNAWFSGRVTAAEGHGWYLVGGARSNISGCQAQDNTGNGFLVWQHSNAVLSGCMVDGANALGEGVVSGQNAAAFHIHDSTGVRIDGIALNRFAILTTPHAVNLTASAIGCTVKVQAEKMATGGATGPGLTVNGNTVEVMSSTAAHRVNLGPRIITSANGTRYELSVGDDGALTTTAL
jgi:hypothetical protein